MLQYESIFVKLVWTEFFLSYSLLEHVLEFWVLVQNIYWILHPMERTEGTKAVKCLDAVLVTQRN